MSEIKDYTKLTLEELLTEQKKVKRQQLFTGLLIGMLIGVIIYGLVIKGFGWLYIGISAFMIFVIGQGAKKLKQTINEIGAEIIKKNAK